MRQKRYTYPRPLKNLFPERFRRTPVLATHRGYGKMGGIAENTLPAFEKSEELGFSAHELDVRITADDMLVLLHGPRLEQTTSGKGRVEKQNWNDIKTLNWANYLPENFTPPLLLQDYLKKFHESAFTNIEIKKEGFFKPFRLEKALLSMLQKKEYAGDYLISSFNIFSLYYLRKKDPQLALGLLVDKGWYAFLKIFMRVFIKPDSIHLHRSLATAKRIFILKRKGYSLLVWGIQTPEEYSKMADLGVEILVTDNMDLIKYHNSIKSS